MAASCSAMPPLMLRCGLGCTCFLTMRTCSTKTRSLSPRTRSTRPRLPLSVPVITSTVSLRCNFNAIQSSVLPASRGLDNFRSERHNFQKFLFPQFTGHWTKHAGANWLAGVVDQDCGVRVKSNVGPVTAAIFLARPDYNRLHHDALLDLAVRRSFLNRCS